MLDHCVAKAPPGTIVSGIFLDEIPIAFQGNAKGHAFADRRQRPDGYAQRAPRSKRRGDATYVDIICDRPNLQPPAFASSDHLGRARLPSFFARLQAACLTHVAPVKHTSEWND